MFHNYDECVFHSQRDNLQGCIHDNVVYICEKSIYINVLKRTSEMRLFCLFRINIQKKIHSELI